MPITTTSLTTNKVLTQLARFKGKTKKDMVASLVEDARKRYNKSVPKMIQNNAFIKMTKDTPSERARIAALVKELSIPPL